MLKKYLTKLHQTASRGDAREESFYPALSYLLEIWAEQRGIKGIHVTTLPRKTEAGNPDFRIWDGNTHITGYIEAKPPTTKSLDQVETSGQLQRYLKTFPNLILTNFFEFRLYRDGTCIDRAEVGRPFVMTRLGMVPPPENEDDLYRLLDRFFSFSLPRVKTARSLAVELAKRTRFLRDEVIKEELLNSGFIAGFYKAFSQYLIANLREDEFADLFCQTITYGLFAARTRAQNGFNRKLAYDYIPRTIGILRDIFRFISLGDLPSQMEWVVDDISEVLAVTDVQRILHEYFHEGKGTDPVVHFYETFLSEYDPATREKRGVYYTPEPVVSYIVRSVHHILKEKFKRPDGLADMGVTVLDPAAGTLTFLTEAARVAVDEFSRKFGSGGKGEFIRRHILQNFYGFELMMAPYAIGHLKASFLLEEMKYRLRDDERFRLYLTNTLEMEELEQTSLPGMASLSEESHEAGRVKKSEPILVVMGNPPYSGHSANVGQWISREIREYYQVDGRPIGEKNPKWLQDDYVKFLRFAQWKIEQAGEGIVAFITNHAYLDNPTFRGMRQSLMRSFNEIYLLDLHGNSLKKERSPDGSEDRNVFDIRQGVAIGIFVKRRGKRGCRVYHADLWGRREGKYRFLEKHSVKNTKWRRIRPEPEFYLFVPRDNALLEEYQRFWKITDIFPLNSVGVVTARDRLTIRMTPQEVWNTVLNFSRLEPELARSAYGLGRDVRDWKVELAQKDLLENGPDRRNVVPILYRPFDVRYTYYTGRSRGFHCMPRKEVMQHMLKENIAIVTVRQVKTTPIWQHVCVSDGITESCYISNRTSEIAYIFPLYLYSSDGGGEDEIESPSPPLRRKRFQFNGQLMLHEPQAGYGDARRPNLSPEFMDYLKGLYKKTPTPEEIFHYIYAVLYSNTYRQRYAEFLKIDFPRIPFPETYRLLKKMASFGEKLVNLHLMRDGFLPEPVARFQGRGSGKVEKLKYDPEKGLLHINRGQFFEGIKEEVYKYQTGGYQVLEKYLKDRRGRTLSLQEIRHYCQMVSVLRETIKIQREIDKHFANP
jgi:hypothetical protein